MKLAALTFRVYAAAQKECQDPVNGGSKVLQTADLTIYHSTQHHIPEESCLQFLSFLISTSALNFWRWHLNLQNIIFRPVTQIPTYISTYIPIVKS
jgi:hypothetical protein